MYLEHAKFQQDEITKLEWDEKREIMCSMNYKI